MSSLPKGHPRAHRFLREIIAHAPSRPNLSPYTLACSGGDNGAGTVRESQRASVRQRPSGHGLGLFSEWQISRGAPTAAKTQRPLPLEPTLQGISRRVLLLRVGLQTSHYPVRFCHPTIISIAPQERSVYYFANAESHFFLEQYDEALPLYQTMLSLCKPNEMPDAFYRIGFIHTYRHEWIAALDNLQSALVYYRRHRPEEQARIAQIRNMIKGCCDKIKQGQ